MTTTPKFAPSKVRLKFWMQDCRSLTLSLFENLDYETFCCQAHADFSPIGWHLGHIAYTEALWLLQRCAGQPPIFPEYHRLFAQGGLPKGDRVHLPPLGEVLHYLEAVRSQVFDYLETAPLETEERLWKWLLQHESQHAETVAIVLKLQERNQRLDVNKTDVNKTDFITDFINFSNQNAPMICIPAGYFEQGSEAIAAMDNERPTQQVYLDTYWIDQFPVTCGAYRSFMQSGGYQNAKWWSDAGWQWLQKTSLTEPLYWRNDPTYDDHPVCGVNWFEADAYTRFVGKRLPTEAEWEKAASWNSGEQRRAGLSKTYPWGNEPPDPTRCHHAQMVGTSPVRSHPKGQSHAGCHDLLGNVWEWTASWFDGYPGFESYPYPTYSQAYFDGQHRVLKGGSWATYPWALRSSFRNWYYPHVREIFAGFRAVRDTEP
ncbi:SUMF1/EgtB/PvdO family nonheme iron enzyme [Phormidesmis sp. 146-33]